MQAWTPPLEEEQARKPIQMPPLALPRRTGVEEIRQITMNTKKAKKLRKYARKQVKEEIGEGLQALGEITRSRPKWIPKRIWILAYLPLFPRKYLAMIYKHMQ